MVERISERTQTVDAAVPQKLEEPVVDQPGDQACRDSADEVHRQGCRYACCDATTGPSGSDGAEARGSPDQRGDQACCGDATTGPSNSDFGEDCGSPSGAVRRDSCGCARDHADHAVDGTTGPPVSDSAEDRESPAGAARERVHEQIVDVPVSHVALKERSSERMHAQIVDVPVPQKMKESVEPVSRDSAACGDATTGPSDSNCAKDGGFPVNQPRDQANRASADSAHRQGRRRAGGDAMTGPSDSDFIEDCGSPAGAVRRQSYHAAPKTNSNDFGCFWNE